MTPVPEVSRPVADCSPTSGRKNDLDVSASDAAPGGGDVAGECPHVEDMDFQRSAEGRPLAERDDPRGPGRGEQDHERRLGGAAIRLPARAPRVRGFLLPAPPPFRGRMAITQGGMDEALRLEILVNFSALTAYLERGCDLE